ncbi:MAG: hypothetical protein R3B47_04295 [Bacteroidia bacterium]
MKTHSLRCSNCGSNLHIPSKLSFVSCSFCGSSLAIKHEGSVFFAETLEQIQKEMQEILKPKSPLRFGNWAKPDEFAPIQKVHLMKLREFIRF